MADRHYNRQSVGAKNFVPPGRCLVLATEPVDSFWVTSWPFAEFVKHAWAGAWVCSAYRNEGAHRASEAIREAVAATRAKYPETPPLGMIAFVDRAKVRPTMVRGVATWGRVYRLAGFRDAGETKGGLLALQLLPEDMPPARAALPRWSAQMSMFDLFARMLRHDEPAASTPSFEDESTGAT